MTFEEIIEIINPEIHHNLKRAVELGKWPNGIILSEEQKENCLRAIIFYEAKSDIPENQQTGYIDTSKKTSPCASTGLSVSSNDTGSNESDIPVRIIH